MKRRTNRSEQEYRRVLARDFSLWAQRPARISPRKARARVLTRIAEIGEKTSPWLAFVPRRIRTVLSAHRLAPSPLAVLSLTVLILTAGLLMLSNRTAFSGPGTRQGALPGPRVQARAAEEAMTDSNGFLVMTLSSGTRLYLPLSSARTSHP